MNRKSSKTRVVTYVEILDLNSNRSVDMANITIVTHLWKMSIWENTFVPLYRTQGNVTQFRGLCESRKLPKLSNRSRIFCCPKL